MTRPISYNPFRPDATASTSIGNIKSFQSTALKTDRVKQKTSSPSFIESVKSFFSTRFPSIWTGQDAPPKRPMTSNDLAKTEAATKKREGYQVLGRLDKMLDRVETNFINREGLYRVSPGESDKAAVREKLLNFQESFDIDQIEDPDILTALVKEVVRERIPGRIFDSIPKDFDSYGEDAANLQAAARAINQLPKDKQVVLARLVEHCVKLGEHSDTNKMTSSNLAIVFGPNMTDQDYTLSGKDKDFFKFLVDNPDVVANPSNYI